MGKFFKEIALIILVLFFSRITFSQINDITRLPGQDSHQSITRSASVMLSENEILVFYANEKFDTIFIAQSNDGGLNWSESEILKTIDHPDNQRYFDLIANKSSTGRILVAWSVKWIGINIIYSDDNGVSWSQPQVIVGLGDDKFNCTYLNFSNYPDGKIAISFHQYRFSSFINSTIYLKTSSDNGTTWSENTNIFPQNGTNLCIYSFDNQNMIAALQIESSGNSGIFMMKSSDGGGSWSDTSAIVNTTLNETNPKLIALDNGNLVLTFQRKYHTNINNFKQNDIIYITSMDQGTSWNNEVRFTKYIGNDISPYLSSFNNKTFISFSTQRFDNIYQLAFGIIGETIEKFTPPFIYQTNISNVYNHDTLNQTFNYEAVIIDDDSVAGVSLEYADSTLSGELYDDGMHSDGDAGDNIFGNAFPFPPFTVKDVYEINTSKFKLPIKNNGVIADTRLNQQIIFKTQAADIQNNKSVKVDTQNVVYSNSVGKFEDGSFLYSAGFFLSGLTNGEAWANGVASSSLINDYIPGLVNSDKNNPKNKLYIVKKNDQPFGSSWIEWKDAVSQGAKFYDGNGDGIYNPIDKNFNGIWDPNEDMPFILGDETIFCVYNDGLPLALRRFNCSPQGIEIRQTMFISGINDFQNAIFINYSIDNTGLISNSIDSVYFGFYADADIGDANNDLVGCETLLNSGFTYSDTTNETFAGNYGKNPPAFFTALLQGPIVRTNNNLDTAFIKNGERIGETKTSSAKNLGINAFGNFIGGDPDLTDPNNVHEVRNYLMGHTRTGAIVNPCTFPYGIVKSDVDCSKIDPLFWFSGDPVTQYGWLFNIELDVRTLLSTGPFNLEKNKPQEITAAFVVGRGTDNFNSITEARRITREVIQEYKNNYSSLTYQPGNPVYPVVSYKLYHNYPNPFNPTTTIRYELPQDGIVTIDIYNILGQKVRTILNEFKKAERYEVEFNGNGLASGVYIYRMKVNDFITSKKMLLIK